MTKKTYKVQIDTREQERGIQAYEYYDTNYNSNITVANLEYGDYLFFDKVVFEYKSIDDFCSSFENGSVFNEVYNQSNNYPHSYLVIVGDVDKALVNRYYKVPNLRHRYKNPYQFRKNYEASFYGAIRRCRVVANVIFCKTREEAFEEMIKQADKCNDEANYYGSVRKIAKKESSDPKITFLTSISGVGKTTAEKIIEHNDIKTLKELVNLTYDDLEKIPRFQKKLIPKILEELNR